MAALVSASACMLSERSMASRSDVSSSCSTYGRGERSKRGICKIGCDGAKHGNAGGGGGIRATSESSAAATSAEESERSIATCRRLNSCEARMPWEMVRCSSSSRCCSRET